MEEEKQKEVEEKQEAEMEEEDESGGEHRVGEEWAETKEEGVGLRGRNGGWRGVTMGSENYGGLGRR